jgi:hypothetical protein
VFFFVFFLFLFLFLFVGGCLVGFIRLQTKSHRVVTVLNGTHQFLAYADDVNLLGDNKDTINNTESLIDASKEVGVEVNREN